MPLRREQVLQGARRLVEDKGLEALTMRALADALGVRAGAIYWHFDNKQALLDAMADGLMAGLLDPPLRGEWGEQLGELARRIAGALGSVRDGARLATSALRPGDHGLGVSERMLKVARAAGFDKQGAIWATSVLGYYVLGYVTDMQATEAAKQHGLRAILREFKKSVDHERFPELSGLTSGLGELMTPKAFRTRFEFGLQAILKGLDASRPRRRRRRSLTPRRRGGR